MCGGVNNNRPVARPPVQPPVVSPEGPRPNAADNVSNVGNNCRVDRPTSPERPRRALALNDRDVFEGAPRAARKVKKPKTFLHQLARFLKRAEVSLPLFAGIAGWLHGLIGQILERQNNTRQLPSSTNY